MVLRWFVIIALCITCHESAAQKHVILSSFPFEENFEEVIPPGLPPGWETSVNRSDDGDFFTEEFQGNARLSSRNATIEQYVITPVFDFTGYRPVTISFTERRSGTFGARVEVRAIISNIDTLVMGETQLTDANTFVPVMFDLPSTLLNENDVRFAFHIIPDTEGTAGTLRIDEFRVDASIQHTHELRVSHMQIAPPLPVSGDTLHAGVTILNAGLEPASGFTISIRSDETHKLTEKYIPDVIAPDDSVIVQLPIPPLSQDIHTVQTLVDYALNEGSEISIAKQIHVTKPVESYPWNENFNYPDDLLPLQWRSSITDDVSDAVLTTSIPHEGERTVILSNAAREQYIILPPFRTADGVLQNITFFERRTGTFDATMYIDISTDRGDSFYEYESFTHSGETDYIQRSVLLDDSLSDGEYVYIRMRMAGDGTGTTGTIRFDSFTVTARLNHDIAISGLEFTPETPQPDEEFKAKVTIRNDGLQPAQDFTIDLYWIGDNTGDSPSLLDSYTYTSVLNSSETTTKFFTISDLPAGYSIVIAEANYPPDLQPDNNIIEKEIFIQYPANILIINEILYHTREGQPEFVEIYNPGNTRVDLYGWAIRDRETPGGQINHYILSDTSHILEPGSFAVLAADSSIYNWFHLNDTHAYIITAGRVTLGLSSLGDEVMLLDPSGSVIDSVAYDPSWHHQDIAETRGRSLERISPYIESQSADNWSTSADPLGGTPGEHNSIFTDTPVSTAAIDVHPNPFSPNASGFEDHTIISYDLPQQTAMVRLRIFDSLGRHIRTLLNNQPSGPTGQVIWDGRNDNGQTARLGIYVILLEAYDDNRSGFTQLKTTVVVADRL